MKKGRCAGDEEGPLACGPGGRAGWPELGRAGLAGSSAVRQTNKWNALRLL